MMMECKSIIWKRMGSIIKPFETSKIKPGILDNTGVLLSKTALNDLNSCMFDVNVETSKDTKSKNNTDHMIDCFQELQKLSIVPNIRMLFTYELS